MSRRAIQFLSLLLPLALLAANGCEATRSPAASPVTYGSGVRRSPVPSSVPKPAATATNNLKNPTPRPSPSATPEPTPQPKASPTPVPEVPGILGQPVAIIPDGAVGLTPDTRNYMVLSAAVKTPPAGFKVAVNSNALGIASVAEAAEPTRSGGDAHMAMRAFEQAQLAGAPAPVARYRVQEATPLSVGTRQSFYVITGFEADNYQDVAINAKLQAVGDHCYVFVDEGLSPNDAALMNQRVAEIVKTFDEKIYPTNTRLFGSEPNPGVDGDPHVVILISPAVGNYGKDNTLGFFSQRDAYLPSVDPRPIFKHSNAREMIYVSSRIVLAGSADDYLGTIAHEFQHMINFNQKVLVAKNKASDDLWIDEGMAMYAIEANGYGLKAGGQVLANHVKRYQAEPEAFSLTNWSVNPDGIGYGPVYLFMVYLADRFSETIIREIVTSPQIGLANVEALLAKRGISFERVFHDWAMANLLDGRTPGGNPAYHYQTLSMMGQNGKTKLSGFTTAPLGLPGAVTPVLKPYSLRFYELPRGDISPKFNLTPEADTQVPARLVLP